MFRAEARGKALILDNAGVVGGNEVFKDRETGSRWQQSSLEAISGPMQGEHLKLYPFLLTSWQEWRRLHPDTRVLKPLAGYADRIAEKNAMIRQGLSGEGAAPSDVTYRDDRLKPKTMILGVDVDGASKAFPLEALRRERVVNDRLGGKPILIAHQPASDTTTAFVARAGGRTLTFAAANEGATELTDRETKSRWTAYGECISGPLKGSALEAIILEPEYWFAWSEFHRDTEIYP
ncbi:MAG: hypothetical protein DMG04_27005 [Acidobacteria bacterium]|nr:MAG: hypothetical protein DMG04_27005 [Acidobacteriota bacterium]PYQ88787.1 MAG: hypothetical protein DMG02_16200 [Acidobacteriota bacterium]PYR11199.1 MAG: hypothetical protein DMF99_09225 [Acidobacteriota bacterium]PYR15329.1 MAG: hypothetical protein DMG00_00820 [Acidobacteriota bacterium]